MVTRWANKWMHEWMNELSHDSRNRTLWTWTQCIHRRQGSWHKQFTQYDAAGGDFVQEVNIRLIVGCRANLI